MDYVHKLNPEEKSWLIKFQTEYHNGKIKVGDRKAFHKTIPLRRDCYVRSNRSMRDLFGIKNCCGILGTIQENDALIPNPEERILEELDQEKYKNAGLVARAFEILDQFKENYVYPKPKITKEIPEEKNDRRKRKGNC